mmetsp:Transcript_20128/g.60831  ORF Transcript_20128/g.60831 Transcript_20128/m.60831 type:complete len:272 (+) Transcript_20128:289-1104(+)
MAMFDDEPASPKPQPTSPSKYAERLRQRKLKALSAEKAKKGPVEPRGGFGILVAYVIVAYLVGTTYAAVKLHPSASLIQAFLAFFLSLNALICFWELALAYRVDLIKKRGDELRARTGDSQQERFAAVGSFFVARCPPSQWFSLDFWSRVWWTYSLYDPSYGDKTTFGFWVDATNGHVTLPPTLLWYFGMTSELVDARAFGIVGLLAFYQELLGTVVYFCTFFANGRHVGKTSLEVALFVGLSNGLWIAGPVVGLYAALRCVYDGDYSVFA